jgi:predicted AAA+ superfamily ATPase|tara:strand:- start:193 stop:1449 length:1257 start_codon:yes stop_codon:yes gene_type:complete
MNKDRLKEIMLDQKNIFSDNQKLIERDVDLDRYIRSEQVVVITGVRRCGKSSLLYLIKQRMKLRDEDYCYFNFDDERIVNDVSILDNLDNLHQEMYGKEAALFLDEIQIINGWEKFVNRLYEQNRKIFVTGSNASLLSSEISTSLTGRNITIELTPFSFNEYCRFKRITFNLDRLSAKDKPTIMRAFNVFIQKGGFPLVVKEDDLELLDAYFKDILYRDIIARHRITQVDELKQMGVYFFANVSKLFSYSTLQKITGIKSTNSVNEYLNYYALSFLFYYVRKFDYSLKKQILNPRKVYAIDQGFSTRIGFNFSSNKGRILENLIFLELLNRKKEIFYFSGKGECDFVIKQGLKISEVIQVCYLLTRENVDREVTGLIEAMNEFKLDKGYLIIYDNEISLSELPETIHIIPAWKWLLDK